MRNPHLRRATAYLRRLIRFWLIAPYAAEPPLDRERLRRAFPNLDLDGARPRRRPPGGAKSHTAQK